MKSRVIGVIWFWKKQRVVGVCTGLTGVQALYYRHNNHCLCFHWRNSWKVFCRNKPHLKLHPSFNWCCYKLYLELLQNILMHCSMDTQSNQINMHLLQVHVLKHKLLTCLEERQRNIKVLPEEVQRSYSHLIWSWAQELHINKKPLGIGQIESIEKIKGTLSNSWIWEGDPIKTTPVGKLVT